MTGLLTWAVAHLLASGDNRSIALFGGLGVWAILEMIFINRREGQWHKGNAAPISSDAIVVIIAAVAFAVILYFHEWLFGVAPIV